ncbi:mesoderm posterior ab [Misgurnus anguillicaudatus]|uniref:mesoderm posterior ab n=1 Tax=Misgurnus anguillicaudatus TaxID=75329 RepID=UPI003CCF1BC6
MFYRCNITPLLPGYIGLLLPALQHSLKTPRSKHLSSFGKITTMEFNFSQFMPQGDKSHFQFEQSPTNDAGYYSACGSLSPSSSIDSGCFSPPASHWLPCRLPEAAGHIDFDSQPAKKPRLVLPSEGKRPSRSKNPGTKRQSASEREKLRMRDLTKALNYLRTFLPPSVAPSGQTLTKIETLRLTISYISHLSEQLGQNQEISGNETTSQCYGTQDVSDRLQCGQISGTYEPQKHLEDNVQYCPTFTNYTDSTQQMDTKIPTSSYVRDAQSCMVRMLLVMFC